MQSEDELSIIQFRLDTDSILREDVARLAHKIHPSLAPACERLGEMADGTVSIWKMQRMPGLGFLYLIHDEDIRSMVLTAVADMAKYAAPSSQNTFSTTV